MHHPGTAQFTFVITGSSALMQAAYPAVSRFLGGLRLRGRGAEAVRAHGDLGGLGEFGDRADLAVQVEDG
jgi:hypothetical protein